MDECLIGLLALRFREGEHFYPGGWFGSLQHKDPDLSRVAVDEADLSRHLGIDRKPAHLLESDYIGQELRGTLGVLHHHANVDDGLGKFALSRRSQRCQGSEAYGEQEGSMGQRYSEMSRDCGHGCRI